MHDNLPPSKTIMLTIERNVKFTPSDLLCGRIIAVDHAAVVRHGYSKKFGNVAVMDYHKDLPAERVEEIKLLMQRGEHPNLVHVLGLFFPSDDSSVCRGYVMEYMHFELLELEPYIHTTSIEYSTERANSWIHQIALGLSYLHEEGVLHRDLNPKRIYLGKFYDDLKIAHLGTAKTLEAKGEPLNGASQEHMAPEVIQKNEFSEEADVYSFAVTIWEIIHREKPYSHLGNVSNFELTSKIVGGERPQIEEGRVPEQLQLLLQRAWNCEPANRPTVSEFLEYARSSESVRIVEKAKPIPRERRSGAVAKKLQAEVTIDELRRSEEEIGQKILEMTRKSKFVEAAKRDDFEATQQELKEQIDAANKRLAECRVEIEKRMSAEIERILSLEDFGIPQENRLVDHSTPKDTNKKNDGRQEGENISKNQVEERITKAVTRISEHLSTVLANLKESKEASSADFLHHYFMFSSFCELHKKKPLSQWVFSESEKLEEFKQQIRELMKQLNSDLFRDVCHWGSENATLLRATRSGLQFLKDDFKDDKPICDLFGNFEEEGYSLYEIDQKLKYLEGKRRDWDDGSDPVDLRGVPPSHYWWSQLERDDSEGTFGKQ